MTFMHDAIGTTGMSFALSEEQAMLRESAARFVRGHYAFEERRKLADSAEGFSRQHWKQFAEMGWLGLNLPVDVGGLDCSFIETCLLVEEFGRGLVLEPFLPTVVLCASLLDACGSESQRQSFLPAVVAGESLLALAHDEGAGRQDVDRPDTRAVASADGFRLDGAKSVVPGASSADRLIVSATLDDELALFLIDARSDGVRIDPYPLVCGQRAGDVHLAGVRCPGEALLARGPAAREALDAALDRARLAAMAQAVGVMEACLEQGSEYLKGRSQFGQPLAKFQALQHLVAEMFTEVQDARSMIYQGLAALDGDAARRARAVAATKIIVGEAGRSVSAKGVQLLGGYGTVDEYSASWQFRSLFVLDHLFGDSVHHLERFAARSLLLA